jgi:copper chaperone
MKAALLKVTNMTCGGCTGNVARILSAIAGVKDAKVSLEAGEATVEYDEQLTSMDQLAEAVTRAGYPTK